MHERESRGGGLQRMAAMVAREAVMAREVRASPVTAREAVVARKDPVASTAAPVALTRPRGSVALGTAPVSSTAHGSGGVDIGGKVGDGESGRRRRARWVEGFGGEVVAGAKRFFG